VLQYVVLQDFGTESEEWFARVIIYLAASSLEELLEQDAQVNFEAFLLMSQ